MALTSSPRFVYRHYWSEGDLVMWDNRCLVHLAVGGYDPAAIRHILRTSGMDDHYGRLVDPAAAVVQFEPPAGKPAADQKAVAKALAKTVAALHD